MEKEIKTDFSDYLQIDMQDSNQVNYWTGHWNISVQELVKAVKSVDCTVVSDIEVYLKKIEIKGAG